MRRNTMKWIAGAVVAASGMVVGVAAATAQPPAGQVPVHQHYVTAENGDRVPVGPNACEDGQSAQFDNFHNNGHKGEPGQRGVIVGGPCPS